MSVNLSRLIYIFLLSAAQQQQQQQQQTAQQTKRHACLQRLLIDQW